MLDAVNFVLPSSDTLMTLGLESLKRPSSGCTAYSAAAILELHKHKGIPYDPAEDGFVFSIAEVEVCSRRLIHVNEARHIEHVLFYGGPEIKRPANPV